MNRRKKLTACLLVSVLLLTACGGGQTSDTQTTAVETTAPTVFDLVEAPTHYVTEEQMKLADPWAGSDESGLAAVMKKAAAGEPITVAVIGGSITQGTISNGSADSTVEHKEMYAEIFRDWWEETFPDTDVTFVNAGIGATDSYLAVHRVRADVLAYEPDVVLVEFSVNDSSSNFCKTAYDNLLRTLLAGENAPAVMLLFMAQTNGSSAQDIHSLVGFNYALPMISYKNVIDDMMESGAYSAKELSGDEVHPSALGHRIAGELLWNYLNGVYEALNSYDAPEPFTKSAVTKEKYTNHAQILDNTTISPVEMTGFDEKGSFGQFKNGWKTTDEAGEITFTATFRNLGILYECRTDGKGGQFEVIVDGERVQTLNADFSGGWGNYAAAQECYTADEAAEHTVTIRLAEGSGGTQITILGLLTSG